MYSKAGRASTEMYTALQHGQDYLENKPRSFRAPVLSHKPKSEDKLAEMVAKKFGQNNLYNDLAKILELETGPKVDQNSKLTIQSPKELKRHEPFSNMLSRDIRDKMYTPKKVSSSAAYYSPKYDWVEKRQLNLVDYTKGTTKRMFDGLVAKQESQSATFRSDYEEGPAIPNKPGAKLKGAIPMDRQTGRPDILDEIIKKKISLTDSLSSPGLPTVLSNVPRLPTINLAKSQPRTDLMTESSSIYAPSYDPNYEFVKKNLGQVGPKFATVSGRKEVSKKPDYTFEEIYDYDQYVSKNQSQVFPRVICPTFDKMSPRNKNHNASKSQIGSQLFSPKNDSYSSKLDKSRFAQMSADSSALGHVLYTRV